MRYDWSWISYFLSYYLFYALLCIWPGCTVLVMFIFYISVCLSVHHTIHWGIIEPFKAHSSNFRHCVSNWTVSLTFTISLMHYSSCLPKNSSILKQFKIFPRNTVSYVLDKTNWWDNSNVKWVLLLTLIIFLTLRLLVIFPSLGSQMLYWLYCRNYSLWWYMQQLRYLIIFYFELY